MVGVANADKLDRFLAPEGDPSTLQPLAWRRSAMRFHILVKSYREQPNDELAYIIEHLQAAEPHVRHRILAAPETAVYVDALLNERRVTVDISVAVLSRVGALSSTGPQKEFSWEGRLSLDYLPLATHAVRISRLKIQDPKLLVGRNFIRLSPKSEGPAIEVDIPANGKSSQHLSVRADRLEVVDGWMPFCDDFDDGNVSIKLSASERHFLDGMIGEAVAIIQTAFARAFDEMLETAQYLSPIRPQDTAMCKLPSFSSPTLPGVIFIGIQQGDGTWIDSRQLAEACIHEHLHNRLYLLEEAMPLTTRTAQPRSYYSPWKQTTRGIDGMLHAIYVFSHLAWFWRTVGKKCPELQQYANGCVEEQVEHLETAAATLDTNELSDAGRRVLRASLQLSALLR